MKKETNDNKRKEEYGFYQNYKKLRKESVCGRKYPWKTAVEVESKVLSGH